MRRLIKTILRLFRDERGHLKCPSGEEHYTLNGRLHREDGPALIRRDEERWYRRGKLHREDGPAVRHWNPATRTWEEEFYLDGHNLSREEYDQQIRRDWQ